MQRAAPRRSPLRPPVLLLAAFALLAPRVAHADGESRPESRPAASKVMLVAGLVTFAASYGMYALHVASCADDEFPTPSCVGASKMLVPVVGYGLYKADDDHVAAVERDDAAERERRARGDGCKNSVIGCGFGDTLSDIGSVLAWLPTLGQVAGLAVVAFSAVPTRPEPRATTSWRLTPTVSRGGATLGVVGTF